MAEKIRITLEGGVIQDIEIPKNLDIVIEVRDYDVEGFDEKCCDEQVLKVDERGDKCIVSEWSI